MRLSCPACGAEMTLDVAIAHEGARAATLAALELPHQLGKPLITYIALFRPPKRQLSHDRLASLLNELLPLIQAAQIERNGRTWSAPVEYWRAALESMIAKRDAGKLQLPLKSHGYLLEVVAGIAHDAEGKAETKREQERAYPYSTDRSTSGPARVAVIADQPGKQPIPQGAREAIDKFLGRSSNGNEG